MDRQSALRRYDYYQGAQRIGEIWTLKRDTLAMRCAVATHSLGWELRLIAGSFSRLHVCRTEAEVFDTADAWKAEAMAKGWNGRE